MDKDKHLSKIALQIAELVRQKNELYGDAFLKVAQILDMMTFSNEFDRAICIRMLDKIFRIGNGKLNDEQRIESFCDISGYAILAIESIKR